MGKRPGADAAAAASLVFLRLGVAFALRRAGFTHVSDDDYARVAIAEAFASSPRLDPSGTSWLPAHFWFLGAGLDLWGRSLPHAVAISMALASAAVAPLYLALRRASVSIRTAWLGVAIGLLVPWNAWSAAATIPEGYVGPLVAAAAFSLASHEARGSLPFVALLSAASLSRYEAWPAAVIAACAYAWHGARARGNERRRAAIRCGSGMLLALAPIAGWIAWNAYAHGDPLHFLARVSKYRRAIGAASIPVADKLSTYPALLLMEGTVAAGLGFIGLLVVVSSGRLRARMGAPAFVALAVLAFLVAGDLGDGAPTHHAARALGPIWFVGAPLGVIALAEVGRAHVVGRSAREAWAVMACVFGGVLYLLTRPSALREWPGGGPDDRSAAVRLGTELRREPSSVRLRVVPCRYEHFALLAAFGAVERVTVAAPRSAGLPPSSACPEVEVLPQE